MLRRFQAGRILELHCSTREAGWLWGSEGPPHPSLAITHLMFPLPGAPKEDEGCCCIRRNVSSTLFLCPFPNSVTYIHTAMPWWHARILKEILGFHRDRFRSLCPQQGGKTTSQLCNVEMRAVCSASVAPPPAHVPSVATRLSSWNRDLGAREHREIVNSELLAVVHGLGKDGTRDSGCSKPVVRGSIRFAARTKLRFLV